MARDLAELPPHAWVQTCSVVQPRATLAARMTLPRRPLCKGGPPVSNLGFGASPLGSVFAPVDEDLGVASVHEAVHLGVNFFDVSPCARSAAAPQGVCDHQFGT